MQGFELLSPKDKAMIECCFSDGHVEAEVRAEQKQKSKLSHDDQVKTQVESIISPVNSGSSTTILEGMRFILAGKFQDNLKESYVAAIKPLGGAISTAFAGTVTHALVGIVNSGSSAAYDSALEQGLPIVAEKVFPASCF